MLGAREGGVGGGQPAFITVMIMKLVSVGEDGSDLLGGHAGDGLLVDADKGVAHEKQSSPWPLFGATSRPKFCHCAGGGSGKLGALNAWCVYYPAEQARDHDGRLVG